MGVRDVDLTDGAPPAVGRARRRLRVACVALVALCSVVVVTAGRSGEPSAVRSERPASGPRAERLPGTPRALSAGDGTGLRLVTPPTPAARVDTAPPRAPITAPAIPFPISTSTSPPTSAGATPPDAAHGGSARPVPPATPADPAPGPSTAYPSAVTSAGHVATDVGCAAGTSATALDVFFRERVGPVLGHDYQHVVALGGDRQLWLFQDTFIDHTGRATRLDQASFAHNTALLQHGRCFTLLHRGTAAAPLSFEPGTGDQILDRWFWPLGGEASGGELEVFWVEMHKTGDPRPPDGLGWIPAATWLATYDATTLARRSFRPASAAGVTPVYGYAVASDAEHTYLFGNSFDQNLARQGGYHACPCSATAVFLARVPRGALHAAPEYRTADGWSADPDAAVPIVDRHHAENPMQPRFLEGRWVAVTKVDGYWGDDLTVDVAPQPWGPWTTVSRRPLPPRGGDPLMNTYHAHLLPSTGGGLVISVSQNARDMLRDAWARPDRYRLQFLAQAVPPPSPPDPAPTTTTTTTTTSTTAETTTTTAESTTTTAETTTSTSTAPATTLEPTTTVIVTSTSAPPACGTTTAPSTTTSSTTSTTPIAGGSTTSTSTSTATTAPPDGC